MTDEQALEHYRRLHREESARADRSGGRMPLKAREALATYARFIGLYERLIETSASIAALSARLDAATRTVSPDDSYGSGKPLPSYPGFHDRGRDWP